MDLAGSSSRIHSVIMSGNQFLDPEEIDLTESEAAAAPIPFTQEELARVANRSPSSVTVDSLKELLEMIQLDFGQTFHSNLDTLFTPIYQTGDAIGIVIDEPLLQRTIRSCTNVDEQNSFYSIVARLHRQKFKAYAEQSETDTGSIVCFAGTPTKQAILLRTE